MSGYLNLAVKIAEAAGQNIMRYHGSVLEMKYTDRTHFKTEVDDQNDALARLAIMRRFPSHGILSEEGTPKIGNNSDLIWVIDGVDGTIGFATGFTDHFSFSIGLCRGKTPIVGVINALKRKGIYSAEIGKGAWLNGQAIHVSDIADINKVLMGVDSGKHNRTAHLPYLEKLLGPNGITCPMATGCATVPLCLVASGVIHAYLATSLASEDMTAAVCIIREAGGKVTNLNGKEWQLGDPSILAANPVLHQKLSEFLGI